MRYRRFLEYVDLHGQGVLTGWLRSLTDGQQADILEQIRSMEQMQVVPRDLLAKLKGNWNGLWEIRVVVDKVRWRPIAFKGPRRGEYTIAVVAKMQNNELEPPSGHKSARRIASLVEADVRRACEFG